MKIHSFSFKNNYEGWEIEKIDFFDLTLLVGISGVGKTQILRALMTIRDIAQGASFNGVEWDIHFEHENQDYEWKGAFELVDEKPLLRYSLIKQDKTYKIVNEIVQFNNKIILERRNNILYFLGKEMPKLPTTKSVIEIFKEEENVKPAYEGFNKILFKDYTTKEDKESIFVQGLMDLFKNINQLKESNINILQKLFWVSQNDINSFKKIKNRFIEVFPKIEDLKISLMAYWVKDEKLIEISIKEKGVDNWIKQSSISSGMLRTLFHISELYLCSKGTVILIDEFENSLGINCIDTLTEDLVYEHTHIQFIATSHHPYIINKIPYEYWKILTRKGGTIKTHDASQYNLGESHHEKFINLINLPEYRTGTETF